MRIVWSPRAIEHLIALRAYIERDRPDAAGRVAKRILDAVGQLAAHPHMGRSGRINGTRELVVADTPYVLPYRVHKSRVEIIAVFHGPQRWPDLL